MRVTGTACGLLLMAALFSCNGAKEPEYTEDYVLDATGFLEVFWRHHCDFWAACTDKVESADECFEEYMAETWMFECFSMTNARECLESIEAFEASGIDQCSEHYIEACSRANFSGCE